MAELNEEGSEEKIIDTCCLLNIYATGDQMRILAQAGGVFVSSLVKSEALFIRSFDQESPPCLIPVEIDLGPAIDAGCIAVCELNGKEEFDLFVMFAHQLDDGEASVLALAKSRGWIVATDDRKARRIAQEYEIKTISTSQIVQRWVSAEKMNEKQIVEVLQRIERFGRFRPHRTDPLFDWWVRIVSSI
jgi:hypothetical protein